MYRSFALITLIFACGTRWSRSEESGPAEPAARTLLGVTATVRSQWVGEQAALAGQQNSAQPVQPAAQNSQNTNALLDGVTVASGIAVAKGLIVTFGHPASRAAPKSVRYRVTLSDGQQAVAAIAVVDVYSGLTLLELDTHDLPFVEINSRQPAIGSPVLTAAASGIDRPLVTQGIVSGVDRSVPGADLPPLLQCDVLASESSPGAAIVDREGKLLGVIVAVTQPGQRSGWAFAVPASHVQRLLAARRAGELVVLERRRPTVGLTMGPGPLEGTVRVERVVPGGPADQAGIRAGDLVLEAQGRKIRSAYQAVDLILNRQPGDTLQLVIEQNSKQRSVDLKLAGAAAPAQAGDARGAQEALVGPQVNVRRLGPSQLEVRGGGNVAELSAQAPGAARRDAPGRAAGDELSMLKIQVSAFEKVILNLQEELRRRGRSEAELRETINALEAEVGQLRRKINDSPPARQQK